MISTTRHALSSVCPSLDQVLLKHTVSTQWAAPQGRSPSTWGAGRRKRRRIREKTRSSVDLLPNNKTAGVAAEVPYVMGYVVCILFLFSIA